MSADSVIILQQSSAQSGARQQLYACLVPVAACKKILPSFSFTMSSHQAIS